MKTNLKYLSYFLIFFIANYAFAKRDEVFQGLTSIEKPFELRDPFQAPRMKRVKENAISSRISSNVYDDSPSIERVKVSDIQITGVVIGKVRRAFAQVKGINRVVVLKEGMIIGENDAQIKAILPGGIVLVEKNTNIYGEEEFLETVIPLIN